MFKGVILLGTAESDENIVFTPVIQSNSKTRWDAASSALEIREPGYYNIDLLLNVTGVEAGNVNVMLLADGNIIPEAVATFTSGATTSTYNVVVHDTIKVNPSRDDEYLRISARIMADATITDGTLIVQAVR